MNLEHRELESEAPRTAQASERPCQLRKYHAGEPTRTQGHHRHPVYLQNRVYGKIQDSELLWLCGTCHDSVHDWIGWLLREARKPIKEPGRLVKREAERTVKWYIAERERKYNPPRLKAGRARDE